MDATIEGIGSRKWSFEPTDDGRLYLNQGATRLAEVYIAAADVKPLLATAPQLWEAANAVIAITHSEFHMDPHLEQAIDTLADMVAKAVGKQAWGKVWQA